MRFAKDVLLWCVAVLVVIGVSAVWAEAPADGEAKAVVTSVTADTPEKAGAEDAAKEAPAEEPKDPERVLVSVDGAELRVWQADVMLKHGAGRSLDTAAKMWIDIKVKLKEAMRRGLEKDRENAFILDLYKEHYLAMRIMDQELAKDMPTVSEDEVKKSYEENKQRYERKFSATVQHITVRDRELANKLVAQAKQEGADFDKLLAATSVADDKDKKGVVRGGEAQLAGKLGKEAADAVTKASNGEVLGPFVGMKGFEIVLVKQVTAAGVTPLEKVKESIERDLQRQAQMKQQEEMMKKLTDEATIVKSAELEALEKEAAEKAAQNPGPPGRGAPPVR